MKKKQRRQRLHIDAESAKRLMSPKLLDWAIKQLENTEEYSEEQAAKFEDELSKTPSAKHGPKCRRTKYGASIGCTFHYINGNTYDCRIANLDHTRDSDNASVTIDGKLIAL